MAFLYNIPQSTDQISVSQGNILNNFQILGAIAGNASASSASINSTSGFNWLYLPPNGAIPPSGSAFTAGNIGIYSAENSVTSQNELYISKQNESTTVQVAATASILSVNSAPGANSSGWSYLPSGLLFKWGNSTANGNTSVTFPTGATIPAFAAIFSCVVTPCPYTGTTDSNQYVALNSFSTTAMVVWGGTRTTASAAQSCNFQYIAIGM